MRARGIPKRGNSLLYALLADGGNEACERANKRIKWLFRPGLSSLKSTHILRVFAFICSRHSTSVRDLIEKPG